MRGNKRYGACDDEKGGRPYETDRYDIRFDLADYYGGLHCGETFDVMVGGRWKPTRIEMAENWYLVGIHADDLSGLRVRI